MHAPHHTSNAPLTRPHVPGSDVPGDALEQHFETQECLVPGFGWSVQAWSEYRQKWIHVRWLKSPQVPAVGSTVEWFQAPYRVLETSAPTRTGVLVEICTGAKRALGDLIVQRDGHTPEGISLWQLKGAL